MIRKDNIKLLILIILLSTPIGLFSNVNQDNCNKISNGMAIDKVKSILGEPTTNSETDMGSLGKITTLVFQLMKGGKIESCTVSLKNGKVQMKSWMSM